MSVNHKINVINRAEGKINVAVEHDGNSVEIIISSPEEKVQLSSVKPGRVFRGNNGAEYILLEFDKDGNACVLKKELLQLEMKFGETNSFDGSEIDKFFNTLYKDVMYDEFGSNLVVQELDLITMDGNREYGKINRMVSLLDFDRYRRRGEQIGEDMDRPWWLRDADSTLNSYVRCVGSSGYVGYGGCGWGDRGVRSFCILKSSIFVSLVETE